MVKLSPYEKILVFLNMKTEQDILKEIDKLKNISLPNLVETINESVADEKWDDAMEACFSLSVNLAALEAALRVIEK